MNEGPKGSRSMHSSIFKSPLEKFSNFKTRPPTSFLDLCLMCPWTYHGDVGRHSLAKRLASATSAGVITCSNNRLRLAIVDN